MSSFPLTNSIIFQDGYRTTNQLDSTRFGVTWAVTAGKETTFEHAAALAVEVNFFGVHLKISMGITMVMNPPEIGIYCKPCKPY